MPELPETETIARDLDAAITGSLIESVLVTRPDVLREVNPRELSRRLKGARIEKSWRRAKLHRSADHELSHSGKNFARGAI